MAGFGDIAPAVEVVNIRGTSITMHALSYNDIVSVVRKAQEVAKAIDGGVSVFELAAQFPDIVASLLAIGLGKRGDEEVETEAVELSIGDQSILLEALCKATFAEGYGPFVKMMRAIGWNDAERIIQELIAPWSPSSNSTESTQKPLAA